ncbi:proteasome assembly chaperone 4 [Bufo gargarizans]|uniref:proteasome assembly chaperone 4 n=1 Tax=Bufo gargarizans TaxID=30331 RepID=UPI001CF5E0C3|nr:proteasome assembly chaperone 4 [Bufo gargarizans]
METMELSHRSITIHNFSEKISDRLVHFHVMSLQDCFFLWVGYSARLCNLAVAMCSRFDSMPLSSQILGDKSDTTSSSFAQRLAKKTKKQVFASVNIPTNDSQLMLLVEKRIKEEMDSFPEKF